MNKKHLSRIGVCLVGILAAATPSQAAIMTLSLSDGVNSETFTDNGTGLVAETGLTLDNWTIFQVSALGPGVVGNLNSDLLLSLNWDLTSAANNTAPLTITLTESGLGSFSSKANDVTLSAGGVQAGGATGTITQNALINNSLLFSQGPFTSSAFSGTRQTAANPLSSPFTISEQLVINNLSGFTSGGANLEDVMPVSEPSYGLKAGALLLGLAGIYALRPRKQSGSALC